LQHNRKSPPRHLPDNAAIPPSSKRVAVHRLRYLSGLEVPETSRAKTKGSRPTALMTPKTLSTQVSMVVFQRLQSSVWWKPGHSRWSLKLLPKLVGFAAQRVYPFAPHLISVVLARGRSRHEINPWEGKQNQARSGRGAGEATANGKEDFKGLAPKQSAQNGLPSNRLVAGSCDSFLECVGSI
jgi:hypothetical protein